MTTALVYDPIFLTHETGRHPEKPKRIDVIIDVLQKDQPLWDQLIKLGPRPAADEDIMRCHGAALIDHIRSLCERGEPFVDLDTVISPESFDAAQCAAGAAIVAVDAVMTGVATNAFALVRPPGHHATPDRSMGFCLFNNAAIGARYAKSRYGVERVVIVDWDVHHGNGTQDIFYRDPSVFYFSTHQYPHYPGTGSASEKGEGKGEGYTLNIPLRAGTPAHAHREIFSAGLKEIEQRLPPDLVIISAGFDSRIDDPLGDLQLEDRDFAEMTAEVMDLADRHATGRVVSVLECGYNLHTLGESVRTHLGALNRGPEQ
jgi:acetoin utilization deacetylase AcuC-like enzyme